MPVEANRRAIVATRFSENAAVALEAASAKS